jgi:hypothetical protein
MAFTYTAFIPSLQKRIEIKELCFSAYKALVKLVTNNNNTQISAQFNQLITDLTGLNIKQLSFLDKLIILLTIRSVCVADELELTVSNPINSTPYNTVHKLFNVIEKIEKLNINEMNSAVTKTYNGTLQVTFGLPSDLYYSVTHDSLASVIKKIFINNKKVILDSNQLESLPISVFKDAKEYLNGIEEKINNTTLISIEFASNDIDDTVQIPLTILQNSALEFLKLCYKKDLLSMYELEYILTTKLNVPYELVKNSTYAENMLYLSFYNKEKKEQEKEQKRSQPGIPLRP